MASTALSRRASEFLGVALFAVALIWLISLASYSASDPVWFFNTGSELPPANFAGRVGAFIGELSYQLLGYSAYLVPLVGVVVGWHYFWCRAVDAAYTKLLGAALLFSCISSFLSLAFGSHDVGGKEFRAGGFVGDRLASLLAEYLNRTGSIILILTLLFAAIILSTQFSFGRLFSTLSQMARERWAAMKDAREHRREEKARDEQRQEVLKKHLGKEAKESKEAKAPAKELTKEPVVVAKMPARPAPPAPSPSSAPTPSLSARVMGAATAALKAASAKPTPPAIRKPVAPPIAGARGDAKEPPLPLAEPEKVERRKGAYTLPPNALLDAPKGERKIDERELMDGARLLEDKCREFSVEGTVVQIHPGPVVTTYEFKPDAGVKYSKITGLADDLCLAMQAESVIIDRIPGKSTVGIQIPNPNREAISLRELLESDAYKRSGSKLTLAMGKTIHGEPFVSDLATMPHLLIAGSTGAGKSVSVNAMITSILMRATPDDVRFIMVDPKRLELGMYEDIPHLLTPVVMDPKLAANALRWAVREMEERYKTLAAFGVRNIEQYNRNVRAMMAEKKDEPLLDDKGNEIKPLPFIVVLIDELADLMMVAGNEVE
jgi:S-DNA-T family DNA segregation ATPase FtsK/SpoIIIE